MKALQKIIIFLILTNTLSSFCWALPVSNNLKITITGVTPEQKKNIESQLSLLQKSKTNVLAAQQIQLLHTRAEKEILKALQPYGYYHATVKSTINHNEANQYNIQYTIDLGKPTLIGWLHTKLVGPGAHNENLCNIFGGFELKPHHILNHALYEKDKTQALSNAIHQGYLHAYYSEHQVIVDLSQYKANVSLVMNSGPLFTLGPVYFKSDYFSPQFLNRFIPYKVGDFYTPDQVAELENALSQSPYFKEVTVSPQIPMELTEDNTVVPIDVTLVRNAANQYLFGVGYDTNTLARVRIGWDRLYLNQWGHRLTTNAKLSQIDKIVESDYIIPGRNPLNDEYRLAMLYTDDEFQDKPSTLYSVAISETHKVKNWHRTLTLRYLSESFKDTSLTNEYSRLLLPSVKLVQTKNDNNLTNLKPVDAYRLSLSLRGGINPFLSDKGFAQANFEGKWLKTLTSRDTLITRAEMGITTPENLADLPLSIRFFAGGDQSIRGYGYRSLPNEIDKNGISRPVGGAYLAVGSIEYNRHIKGPFSVATFVDGGNAFNSLDDLQSEFQIGLGIGVLFATPIGPIKIYLAKPVTSHTNSWRVHLNFGPEI